MAIGRITTATVVTQSPDARRAAVTSALGRPCRGQPYTGGAKPPTARHGNVAAGNSMSRVCLAKNAVDVGRGRYASTAAPLRNPFGALPAGGWRRNRVPGRSPGLMKPARVVAPNEPHASMVIFGPSWHVAEDPYPIRSQPKNKPWRLPCVRRRPKVTPPPRSLLMPRRLALASEAPAWGIGARLMRITREIEAPAVPPGRRNPTVGPREIAC